ncbi:MAG: ABC transporter ATP-binding protein [Haloarculaceae archaeon]
MTASARGLEQSADEQTDDAGTVPPPLVVDGVSKTYESGDRTVQAVEDVSLSVERGTVLGVLGPNGAGKTTLIKSILGLVVPTAGTVEIAGVDVHADTRRAYHHVGAMLEGARNVYWKLTVRENLRFFAAVGGQSPAAVADRHEELLEQLHLLEEGDTAVRELSRGQKQKVALACALARDADVAFLDEPTLGLDVEASLDLRREIRRLAEREKMTVVLSSHDMQVVEDVCDRVVIMNDGEVVADDSVGDLVDVFRTHAYEVTLAAPLDAPARERLRERFDAESFETRGEGERFAVSLGDPDRLYDLMDALRAADATVTGVDSVDPDLESVFIEMTGGGGDGGERA